jgi:hypothetical protein
LGSDEGGEVMVVGVQFCLGLPVAEKCKTVVVFVPNVVVFESRGLQKLEQMQDRTRPNVNLAVLRAHFITAIE